MADIANLQIKVDTNQVKTANKDLDALSRSSKGAETASQQLNNAFANLKNTVVGYLSLRTVQQIASVADSYTKLTAQLKLATQSQQEFNQAYENVQRISETAQSSIEETSILYARLSTSLRELNATQRQVSDITEAVALGLKVSGATASETASVMLQLSQAFGSGVLRGEEFNAVNENGGRIMQAVADYLGVARGELRGMAFDGKLTSDIVGNALIKSLEKMRVEAEKTRNISGGITGIKNEFVLLVGEIDRATGASEKLSSMLKGIAEDIKRFREGENSLLSYGLFGPIPAIRNLLNSDPNRGMGQSGTIRRAGESNETPLLPARTAKVDQDEIDRQRKLNERKRQEHLAMRNELLEMDKKYLEISNNTENKIIEESRKSREESIAKIMEIEQRRADENFEEAQRMSKKTTDEWKDAFEDLKNAVDGYSRDMSRSLAQFALGGKVSFADMIDNMLLKLLEFANQKFIFDPLFKAITGQIESAGGGGNLLGGLISGIGNFFTGGVGMNAGAYSIDQNPYLNFAGARASGGNVSAGSSYLVGERGAELFVPNQNGAIVPNGGQSKTNVTVNVIEAQGTKANVQQQQNPDGTMSINVIVEQLYGVMNRDLQRGTGIAPTIERRYGLNRVAGAY